MLHRSTSPICWKANEDRATSLLSQAKDFHQHTFRKATNSRVFRRLPLTPLPEFAPVRRTR